MGWNGDGLQLVGLMRDHACPCLLTCLLTKVYGGITLNLLARLVRVERSDLLSAFVLLGSVDESPCERRKTKGHDKVH